MEETHIERNIPLTIRVVDDIGAFDALESEWNALLDRSEASVFQTFEWQRTWWKHLGETNRFAELHIVLVTEGERTIGIAPLFIERVRTLGFIPYRRLAFIGTGLSDYLDVLFERGREEECARAVAEHIASVSDRFDVIVLQDMTDRFRNHHLLNEALHRLNFEGEHFVSEYCPRTALQATWEETLASFKIDNRREIRRRQRNLHKNFSVEYEVITDEADALRGINDFIAMHQQKWRNEGHRGVFADSEVAEFHREVAQLFAQRGWLYLAFLNANGNRAATLYCFMFRDELAVYLTGNANRSDVFKYSPGRVLTAFCMEEAVKVGKKVCDFMRGTEHYKYEMDARDVPNWTILRYSPRSIAPEFRYKSDLLVRALLRRSAREWLLLRTVVAEHGLFSRALAQHLEKRLKEVYRDGLAKARTPQRATHLEAKKNGQSQIESR